VQPENEEDKTDDKDKGLAVLSCEIRTAVLIKFQAY
jgi:hypothetical protein